MKNNHMKYLIYTLLIIGIGSVLAGVANAQTRFLSGYRDGIWVYGVIEHNGIQYRTDQNGRRSNQLLWGLLSSADKMKLAKTYSYMTNRLSSHFGKDFRDDAINPFINQETGWSALVDTLKDKHANKAFPDLAQTFGPGAMLDLPGDPSATCWDVIHSQSYRDAVRLKKEIEADFSVGRAVYTLLVNANWDQVAISVKALSGPLIQVIVSNFITGFVTHGASEVSDLLVTAESFVEDLKKFIDQRYAPGTPEPDAAELIAKLDQYLEDMAQTALTAKRRVEDKSSQLQSLVEQVEQMEQDCLQSRRDAAEETRSAIADAIWVLPNPYPYDIAPDPVPEEISPDQRDAWIFNNMHDKVYPIWLGVKSDAGTLQEEIDILETGIRNRFDAVSIPGIGDPFNDFYAGMTSGFDGKYRRVDVVAETFQSWDLSPNRNAFTQARTVYDGIHQEASNHIDEALPRIDPLHAKALGLDAYADYLGGLDEDGVVHAMDPPPSAAFAGTGIRNFDAMISIIATPEQKLTQTMTDLETRTAVLDAAEPLMAEGIANRTEWIQDACRTYENLIFNFENSLSYAIATLRQIDTLHADPYFVQDRVIAVYDGVEVYSYKIDTEAILSEIAANGTDAATLQQVRQAALKRLFELTEQEQALIQKLIVSRNSHLNDAQALTNFYDALSSHYSDAHDMETVFADVARITGKTMKNQYDAWHDLAPDITYYYLGAGNWVRTPDTLQTGLFAMDIYGKPSPYGRISGKTETYEAIYALYIDMKTQKASILSLSETGFNEWMSQTVTAMDTYANRLQTEGVYGPGWPCWEVIFETNHLLESINAEYRWGAPPEPPYYHRIKGTLQTAEGFGIPGMDLFIEGRYGEDGSGAHVSFAATTGVNGRFVFEFVGTGNYTLFAGEQPEKTVKSGGADNLVQFTVAPLQVEVRSEDLDVRLTAAPKPEGGSMIAGRMTTDQGMGTGGKTIVLESLETGEIRSVLTLDDGSFSFWGLPQGSYNIRSSEQGRESIPGNNTLSVPPSQTDLIFVLYDGAINIAGDMNNDNLLNLKDVLLALQLLAGCAPDISAHTGDVNHDGRVNMTEAIYLMRVAAGGN